MSNLRKKVMTEFMVDYQIRRDSTGKDTVYKVYLPFPHQGRIMMAERSDAVSPRAKEIRPGISVGLIRFQNSSDETINV